MESGTTCLRAIGAGSLGARQTSGHPHGPWVIAVTQIPDKPIDEAGREYAASNHDFDRWFKTQVMQVTGIDPDAAPLGPPTRCIFDSGPTG